MHMSNSILSEQRKITPHREIARISWAIQVCPTQSKNVRRVWFKEGFTYNKIWVKALNIGKAKFYILLMIWPWFIELKTGQKQKGRLWVHETPILEVSFVTLTENSSFVTVTPRDLRNICTTRNSCRDTLPCATCH